MPQLPQPQINLPPIGQLATDGYADPNSYIMGLVREAIDARASFVEQADKNLNVYQFGHDPNDGDVPDVVINEIQNAIIATTDIQTKDPPSVTLEPVETGEPPTSYWSGPPELGLRMYGIQPEQIMPTPNPETGQNDEPLPLDPIQAMQLHQMAATGMLDDNWITDVNDQLVSDVYQTIFDVFWARCGADRRIRSNLLKTNVYGWTIELYEFDDSAKTHRIRPISIKQAYLDPTVEDIEDAAYCGLDLIFDANEAKKLYPEIAAQIDANAHIGQPQKIDGQTDFGQAWESRNFYRPIIELRVFWLRNQPCPMDEQAALGSGQIEQRPIQELTPEPTGEPENAVSPPSISGLTGANAGTPQQDESGRMPDQAGDAAAGMAPLPPLPPAPPRIATFVPGSDVEIDPTHPAWPTQACLRQISLMAGEVVDDRPCEHWDIPVIHNVNIPIPGRPFGQGEPERLKSLQDAISKMFTAIVQNSQYFGHPLTSMPRSVYNELKAAYGTARVGPGRTLSIPDEMWTQFGGKVDAIEQPPQIPPGLVQGQEIISSKFDKLAGQPDVLQGQPPPGVDSGKAIQSLQATVMSTIGFKSQRTGDAVYRLARLMLHSLVHRLDLQDTIRIVSKYPPHVMQVIIDRARMMDWDVRVNVASGSGQVKAQKQQEALNQYSAGLISRETAQEKLDIDTRMEKQREQAQAQEMMKSGQQPQQQGGPGAPQKQSSNGNGSASHGNGRF